jgi:hypothetical protein
MCIALSIGPVLSGCSSGSPGTVHSTKPGVTQIGEEMMRSVGVDLEAILGYRFADSSLGDEWLVVDLALTSWKGEAIEVKQEAISVVTPDGRRIQLPTQKEFIAAYPQIQSLLRRAAIASGMLVFPVQGGIQPGRWRLVIELEESDLQVPFDLGG